MASNEALNHDATGSTALELSRRMETLAAAGEWDQIEDIALRLRSAVTRVPAAERRALLPMLQRSIENVAAEARQARQSVSGRLSELRRGQVAKKAYELR